MRTVGLGIQEFEKIRKKNLFYVDKTDFISRWYRKNDDITLITRPRRFGKTLTVDMLYCFFSTTYAGRRELFEGLRIGTDKKMMALQGSVPAIKISFAGVKGESFYDFLMGIAGRIAILLGDYRYLLEGGSLSGSEEEIFTEMTRIVPDIPDPEKEAGSYTKYLYKLTHIFHFLSIWLTRYYGKKVFIFMDEYDTPLQTAYLNNYYEDALAVMRGMFAETFKENSALDRAVITGITRIAKESLFSDMNNLAVCSVVSGGYDDSFGFTGNEMEEILKEYGLEDRKEIVQFWYDGFTVGNERGLYNPWSVANYLSDRPDVPEDYWAQSGGTGLIDHLLRRGSASLKEGFEVLLDGGVIEREIHEDLVFSGLETDEDAVWALLIASGYIKPGRGKAEVSSGRTELSLTNHESGHSLARMIRAWFNTRAGNFMTSFAEALLADDLTEMNASMQQVVLLSVSSFDSGIQPASGNVQPENFFHALTLGMLTCLSGAYHVTSNRESGFGRYDVCIEPVDRARNPFAAVLEFKVFDEKKGDTDLTDTCGRARKQIDEKGYDADLRSRGIPSAMIRRYGFGFRGKDVMITD